MCCCKTEGGTWAASVGSLCAYADAVSFLRGMLKKVAEVKCRIGDLRSLESLVATNRLATVEVAVDTGIDLVQQVRLVRAHSVGGRAGAVSSTSG